MMINLGIFSGRLLYALSCFLWGSVWTKSCCSYRSSTIDVFTLFLTQSALVWFSAERDHAAPTLRALDDPAEAVQHDVVGSLL